MKMEKSKEKSKEKSIVKSKEELKQGDILKRKDIEEYVRIDGEYFFEGNPDKKYLLCKGVYPIKDQEYYFGLYSVPKTYLQNFFEMKHKQLVVFNDKIYKRGE